MTRVLVDLLFYTGRKGGMESYVRELYPRLHVHSPGVEFVGLASRELAAGDLSWFPGDVVDTGISGENRRAWAWGELTAVPRAARRLNADLIHSPANVGPFRAPVPVVLTVHDLLPFRHPEFVPGPYSPVLRTLIRGAARNASRLLTVSEASKADIVSLLGKRPDAVDVTPLAGPGSHRAATGGREPNLLLALGNRMPHKNFDALLNAIALIPEAERPNVIVSGSHGDDPLVDTVRDLGLERSVSLRDWVSDAELERLYATATAVVVPSKFEGFGLPVLEAMARGCPVLCSDLPVLREVAGDAAVYFDPADIRSITATLVETVGDTARLSALGVAGVARAATFSWDRTARQTADAFQRALA